MSVLVFKEISVTSKCEKLSNSLPYKFKVLSELFCKKTTIRIVLYWFVQSRLFDLLLLLLLLLLLSGRTYVFSQPNQTVLLRV